MAALRSGAGLVHVALPQGAGGAKPYPEVITVEVPGADGQFAAVADVTGPSFADSGLAPRSAYRWRVSAVVNGIEGPASEAAAATTRPAPAPCQKPGTCPIGP